MHALRRIHAALVPGGIVADTQPVSAWPRVAGAAGGLGALDMRGWLEIVDAVDQKVEAAVGEGLFTSELRPGFAVADTFDNGPLLAATVADWRGTSIPADVAERLARHASTVRVQQEVRFRLLRAL